MKLERGILYYIPKAIVVSFVQGYEVVALVKGLGLRQLASAQSPHYTF